MRVAAFLPELLRHLFKKPATVDYPFKKLEVPANFRGTPYLRPELCIVCRACERDCPAEAIEITAVNEAEKRFRMVIHNDRCIHCAQCVDSCPTTPKAMQIDSLYELAADDRHFCEISEKSSFLSFSQHCPSGSLRGGADGRFEDPPPCGSPLHGRGSSRQPPIAAV